MKNKKGLEILEQIAGTNKHNKPLNITECTCEQPCDCGRENYMSECPVCGDSIDSLSEPHYDMRIYSAEKYAEMAQKESIENNQWMQKVEEIFACPTAKSSTDCTNGESHRTCDEECYCDCHYATCSCLDTYEPVALNIKMIVCRLHGQTYTRPKGNRKQ